MKTCTKCKESKSLTEYYKHKTNKDGVAGSCKTCQLNQHKKYYEENREYRISVSRARNYNNRYGLEIEEYNKMLTKQEFKCAICSIHVDDLPSLRETHLCVDHNHKTGKIRGLLCPHCNKGIGLLQDSVSNCYNASKYLELHGGKDE